MSQNTITLLTVAAELRAAGASWEAVAQKVHRKPKTCQKWPQRFRERWNELYRDSQARRFHETSEEAHTLLKGLMRADDKMCRLKAIEIWLKNGAAAFGMDGAMRVPMTGDAVPKEPSEDDKQYEKILESRRPYLDKQRAEQGLPPATHQELEEDYLMFLAENLHRWKNQEPIKAKPQEHQPGGAIYWSILLLAAFAGAGSEAARTLMPGERESVVAAAENRAARYNAEMTRKLYIETVGCQMNVLDSELVVGSLRRQGYELADSPNEADLILFNTCSVREHAEEKIYSALGRLAGHKRRHPDKVIGVVGCMAQKDQELVRKRAPHVDLVVGTGQLARIPELVETIRETRQPQYALSLGRADAGRKEVEASFESYDPTRDPSMRPTPFQAYVRIQIGCDKFCTYCIVPSVRGPEQSRHPDHILAECRQLADEGCKEVTLLGQTVNSYEYDHGERRSRLSDLLTRISDINGIERIKFVTNFPKDMTDDLLDAVRELPKASKYLHVPVQSGCNEVLKRMKRLYTAEYYRDMLHRCRERVPGVAISSDFIVGFCGETEESFQKTCDLVREARFKNSFIFKYSPRPGTKADDLFADDVPEEVKKRRNNDLLAIQNANSLADHRERVGQTFEVLVEGLSKFANKAARSGGSGPVQLTGRTQTDHIVVFDGNERLIGRFVQVAVREASPFTLYGNVLTSEVKVTADCSADVELMPSPRIALPLI